MFLITVSDCYSGPQLSLAGKGRFMSGVWAYKVFDVTLRRKELITPSLMRCVFGGEAVRGMKMDAPDQRVKLLFPAPDGTPVRLPDAEDWYLRMRDVPAAQRPIARTYTLRRVNADAGEMDVEFVIHGTEGPASSWAIGAEPGAPLQVVAPRREHPGDSGGYEWLPSMQTSQVLLVADETALPAVKGILEQLAQRANPPRTQAFIEVPLRADCIDLSHLTFADIHWLPREGSGAAYGERLLAAVREQVWSPETATGCLPDVPEIAEGELMWERADAAQGAFFGWVAAESSAVKALRRYLLGERCFPRDAVTFMAYWSRGRAM